MLKYFACILLVVSGIAAAQDQAGALKAARELAGAVKTGDMMWMVERMYPQARKTAALRMVEKDGLALQNKNQEAALAKGEAALLAQYRQMGQELKRQGVVIEVFEVSDPVDVHLVKNQTEIVVILPIRYVMAVKDPGGVTRKAEKKSFLYAIAKFSEKNKWYFIEGTTYSYNEMRMFFPDLPEMKNVKLPRVAERQLQ